MSTEKKTLQYGPNDFHWDPITNRMQSGLNIRQWYEVDIEERVRLGDTMIAQLIERGAPVAAVDTVREQIATWKTTLANLAAMSGPT